jgi:hypothetical protein
VVEGNLATIAAVLKDFEAAPKSRSAVSAKESRYDFSLHKYYPVVSLMDKGTPPPPL